MNRDSLRDRLGLEPSATDAEIVAAARAERSRLNRLASSANQPDVAKVHRESVAELEALLAACGLSSSGGTPTPSGSALSQTMLRDLPGSSPDDVQAPSIQGGLSASMLGDLPGATPMKSMSGTAGEAPGTQVPVQPGRVLAGRYEVRRLLGAGGMGAVYAAYDRTRDEEVALKVILPTLVQRPEARGRFLQEAKVSTSLSHPGIVKCFDVAQDGDLLFLTMELLSGQTLRQAIEAQKAERKPMPLSEVARIGRALCESLGYAHTLTVHRDVKPENIFLCADGRVLLMDFGIARLLNQTQLTRTGAAMGTAYYMAPEQLVSAGEADHRADQFSVCVVLYELLTGRVPAGAIAPVRRLRKDAPPKLADAVMRGLSGDAKERHADMAALAQRLDVRMPLWRLPVVQRLAVAMLAVVVLGGGVVWREPLWAFYQESVRDPVAKGKADQAIQDAKKELARFEEFEGFEPSQQADEAKKQLGTAITVAESVYRERRDDGVVASLEPARKAAEEALKQRDGALSRARSKAKTDLQSVETDLDAYATLGQEFEYADRSGLIASKDSLEQEGLAVGARVAAVLAARSAVDAAKAFGAQCAEKVSQRRASARAALQQLAPQVEAVLALGGEYRWDIQMGMTPKEELAEDEKAKRSTTKDAKSQVEALGALESARIEAEQWMKDVDARIDAKLKASRSLHETLILEIASVCRAYPVAAKESEGVLKGDVSLEAQEPGTPGQDMETTLAVRVVNVTEMNRRVQSYQEFLRKYGSAAKDSLEEQIRDVVDAFKKKRESQLKVTQERKRQVESSPVSSTTEAGKQLINLMREEMASLDRRDKALAGLWDANCDKGLREFLGTPVKEKNGIVMIGAWCEEIQRRRDQIEDILVRQANEIEDNTLKSIQVLVGQYPRLEKLAAYSLAKQIAIEAINSTSKNADVELVNVVSGARDQMLSKISDLDARCDNEAIESLVSKCSAIQSDMEKFVTELKSRRQKFIGTYIYTKSESGFPYSLGSEVRRVYDFRAGGIVVYRYTFTTKGLIQDAVTNEASNHRWELSSLNEIRCLGEDGKEVEKFMASNNDIRSSGGVLFVRQ